MIFNKKAESMSMSTIVIAAVALIVLVVLIVIFSGRMGLFNQGVNDCGDKGGDCRLTTNTACIQEGGTPIGPCFDDKTGKPNSQVCCVRDQN